MKTEIFDANSPDDLGVVAKKLKDGEIGGFPYGGIYGLFCDRDKPESRERIFNVKNRQDPKIGATAEPDDIVNKLVKIDDSKKDYLLRMWKNMPALGVILPAADRGGCVTNEGTILAFWAEDYSPLKTLLRKFKDLGGVALAATSANISGEGTHWKFEPLQRDFEGKVDFIVRDDNMPKERNMSTTVLVWTGEKPSLFREGNVRIEELKEVVRRTSFPEPFIGIEGVDYRRADARRY